MSKKKEPKQTPEEQQESTLKRWLKERRITEVECLVPDITGNARGKIIPAAKFSHDYGTRLPEGIFATTVTGEYPDNYDDLVSPSDSDMQLRPDADTVRMVPWATDPTAQVIHDCYTKEGKRHELAPRNVLRRVLDLYDGLGLQPVIAPELEFFLVQRNTDPDFPLQPPAGRNGRPETARQSYSIDAVNEFDPILDLMYDYCEAMELDVDTLIHESGAAQLEVNFEHADPMSRADQVFLFKRTMREAAMRHGIYATFLAKPMENEPGSSMHIHQSLVDARTGKNVFAGARKGVHSELFMHYLGGLQKYVPAAMAIFGPNVNSYRRLAFGEVSPKNVQWGYDNRTCGLRVPLDTPENTRVESRFAGSDVNPYLALAATLACGYLGIVEKLEPTAPMAGSAHAKGYDLPRSLEEAIVLLRKCKPLRGLLGERFVKAYTSVKEKEHQTYLRVISSWEREFLLLNV
ncbi:glutamine synthetase family protein [Arenimonas metalli]|uniref:Glutamine synthetase n=1 Tax=Arenimonas metalli CF5-1 TaxID=1384056 RepID=A0A091B5A9_9GAMM|nr:glutamine synthetase family protein [Arenimonas metalli]KFN46906.1 glutamine synthetase [Arenimonas metalli CF5-1]